MGLKISNLFKEETEKDNSVEEEFYSISEKNYKEEEANSEIEVVSDTNVVDAAIEETDDIDLPKVKEEMEDNQEEMPKLTNDVLADRLNALKNKD